MSDGGADDAEALGPPRLCVVLCNVPPDEAEPIARAVVERRLAACVNIVPAVTSLYRWEGAVLRDVESTLLIKTREALVGELTAALCSLCSYAIPEVLAVPALPGLGNAAYAAWVVAETAGAS